MRERETPLDLAEEAGRPHISMIAWMSSVVVSFALGAFVSHFIFSGEPISQFSFQDLFTSPFWSTAAIGLGCFVLGVGFACVPFIGYRADADRELNTEYRPTRDKADALRERADRLRDRADDLRIRAAERDESSPAPSYAEQDQEPPDIAAVISEMSAAIKANLKEAGSARAAHADIGQPFRSRPLHE